jgi:hypothetical protein
MAASTNPRLRLLHMRDEIRNLEMELAGLNFEIYQDHTAFAVPTRSMTRFFGKPPLATSRNCNRVIERMLAKFES